VTEIENPPAEAPATEPGVSKSDRARRVALEWGVLIVAALVIAFVIKTFLFQAFYIPSESMVPTLKVGDRVLVNKLSYKLHDVHRGDIVVFDAPPAADAGNIKDLVKRVIGLPGDAIEESDGALYVNGRRLDESYLPKGVRTTISNVPPGCGVPSSQAELPTTQQRGCKVPAGSMFVMGDNRGASKDSRIFGPVKESAIVGRVFVRIWPPGSIGLM
jgi:signal peptidase I